MDEPEMGSHFQKGFLEEPRGLWKTSAILALLVEVSRSVTE